jgi:hypothetical protein
MQVSASPRALPTRIDLDAIKSSDHPDHRPFRQYLAAAHAGSLWDMTAPRFIA